MLKFPRSRASTEPGSAHLLTETQAAERIHKSIHTLRRIRKRGEIGCYQIGRSAYYTHQHIDEFLKGLELCKTNGTNSANIGSHSTTAPSTKPLGTTRALDKHAAHLLAQKTFMKQKSSSQNTP
ncbi:helix-turn-helix domain-containing protein [Agrobacterium cucumeris]|uniref:DNA-binding protein n=2 Tax=Rhizobium/Agrobacterium group TaxID=227290 RepID=A0A546XGL6_RHIRH|nr:DNA-binding protein [Rhizobium rhizogenes]WHO10697.1 helix-turn-helix domain-containing protein [Agrobacterium cucumeris]